MKKIITVAALALTTTTASAFEYNMPQDRYGWLQTDFIHQVRPEATDKIELGKNLNCDVLAIKGWSPVVSDNKIYDEITNQYADATLWVKEDRYAHCIRNQDIYLFNKEDIDNFVKSLSEFRDNARKKNQKNFVEGLDKL